jgi:hypothetical protein
MRARREVGLLLHVYVSNIPAIATANLLGFLLCSLFTTCFGPYGPSSGEIQLHHLHILKKPSILQRILCFTIALSTHRAVKSYVASGGRCPIQLKPRLCSRLSILNKKKSIYQQDKRSKLLKPSELFVPTKSG